MHNMKKLILSVFIFTFGFGTATHAQQVNTLLTKHLPEAPALLHSEAGRAHGSARALRVCHALPV